MAEVNDRVLATIPLPMDLEMFSRLLLSYADDYPDARLANDEHGNPVIITSTPEED